jgi:hypothetical protein
MKKCMFILILFGVILFTSSCATTKSISINKKYNRIDVEMVRIELTYFPFVQ